MHENLALDLVLLEGVKVQFHLLVDACVGVAERMQRQAVFARARDLEAELLFHHALRIADPLEGDDARGRSGLNQEQPPLLELGLGEERSMDRTHGLLLLEVPPRQSRGDGCDVAHDDVRLVLHREDALQFHVADVRCKGLDVQQLLRLHLREALPLLRVPGDELREGRDRVLAAMAVLQDLLVEMRDLEQLGALHVECLHKAPPKLDHRLCREEPLAHARNLNHGLGDLHGILEQLVCVLLELRCHEVMQALHVRPNEELVLHDDRLLELALLVLCDVLREGLHLDIVGGPARHVPALSGGGEQFRAILHACRLVDVIPQELQGLDHHAIRSVVLGSLVVADEGHGHHEEEQEEEYAEDHEVVFLLQEEAGQPNAHLCRLWAVRVPILLIVHLGRLVSECIVCLGDLNEPGGCQGIVWVLVGVVDERELAVGLLDLLG
mmetsp:Transcript_64620/g.179207  ORF Transcript_64620/g.179207 Transcript_64620/m.179207 type:complete len:439 (-) Transcript_64620:582-1898(-)